MTNPEAPCTHAVYALAFKGLGLKRGSYIGTLQAKKIPCMYMDEVQEGLGLEGKGHAFKMKCSR